MNPIRHNGSRHFKCANCRMEMIFPSEHKMVGKMEDTYWIQDQWFCCKFCAQMSYGDREPFNLK